jgi:FG-GAP-like repeat
VTVWRGTGDGRFVVRSGFTIPGGRAVTSLAVGDFDGDARADVAATSVTGIYVRLGQGDGTFLGGIDRVVANSAVGSVEAGDVDGDGLETWRSRCTAGPSAWACC